MTPLRGMLQHELDEILEDVTRMGDMVEHAISEAVRAIVDRDVDLAERIIAGDTQVNQLRFDIEDKCVTAVATQAPAAIDLRVVVTVLNIITELERMADYAKGIGRIVVRTGGQDLCLPERKVPLLAEKVCQMTHAALESFVGGGVEAAERIFEMDDEVDHMYRDLFESVIKATVAHEHSVGAGMHLLFTAHNLERVGDRATNIAERVIFMHTGVMEEQNL